MYIINTRCCNLSEPVNYALNRRYNMKDKKQVALEVISLAIDLAKVIMKHLDDSNDANN